MSIAKPVDQDTSAVAASSSLPILPVGDHRGRGKWTPVSFETQNLMITAGYSGRQGMSVPCITYLVGEKEYRFIQLNKNQTWFLKFIGGSKCVKGDLQQVTVMEQLRKLYLESDFDESAVAEDSQDDPMNSLDMCVERKDKVSQKTGLLTVTMPMRPPCSGADIGKTVDVHLLRKDKAGTRLFMRIDCLDWLLSYAADEFAFGGIVREPESAVAEKSVDWDFNAGLFIATAPHDGQTAIYKLSPNDLDVNKWNYVKDKSVVFCDEEYLSNLSFKTKKEATRQLLLLWCEAVVEGTVNEFLKASSSTAGSAFFGASWHSDRHD